ncbi:MAG: lysylphosphatidylglycerol synthase transmembrane domain-containing protein [Dermatophilaceae bacterium]
MLTSPVTVEVVEPTMPDRVRRPSDVYALLAYVVAVVVAMSLGNVAVDTTGAVEHDLTLATSGLPRLLLQLFSWAGGIGVLVVPVVIGVDLLARSRGWQLVHALLAAGLAAAVTQTVKVLVVGGHFEQALAALSRPIPRDGLSAPLDIVVVTLVALVIVANINGRRWISPLVAVVLTSATLTSFLSGANTALALLCSFLLGAIVGHGVRFAFGTASTRPPGTEIARELVLAGAPLARLALVDDDDEGERVYQGRTRDGQILDVHVLDRDTFGLASGRRLLTRLRLRGATARAPSFTVRHALEHRSLTALALRWAGITAPYPVAVVDVGGSCSALALTRVEGRTLRELGAELTDAQARAVVRMVWRMQDRRIVFRGLNLDSVVLLPDGSAGVRTTGDGDVGADDLTRRADAAQATTLLAVCIGPERALDAVLGEVGPQRASRALPLLQPLGLGRPIRAELKARAGLLDDLRARIIALDTSADEPRSIELRRVSAKGVLTALGGAVAAYLLLTQLAQVDFAAVLGRAEWPWALASLVFAILTFAGASLVLTGSVPTRLRFVRTYMTQLAVAFSGLVAPAAIGNIALNTRYLQKSGVPAAAAGASVGLAQVSQFSSYATLLALAGVVAGTGPQASFQPPESVVVAIPVLVLVVIALFAIPAVRKAFRDRVMPQLRTVVPQILGVLQHPGKLAQLIGGALVLDTAFVGATFCATRAFGSTTPLAAVAVVYFAGAIIGSAVPTPGGLGGIEAAMSAGLIAVGNDSGTAVSAVLLYRLVTYWLPIPFGWWSIGRLQKLEAI